MLDMPNMELPNEDAAEDDEAPERDPDPAPPREGDVAGHEEEILANGFDLGSDEEDGS